MEILVFFLASVNGKAGIFFHQSAPIVLYLAAGRGIYWAMLEPIRLSQSYAVAPRLDAADFARVAAMGFATIVSFLPDGEVAGALSAADARRLAAQHGLAFLHIPAAKYDLFADDVVTPAARGLAQARGPVLGVCSSGQRAAIVWAAASARTQPVDGILQALGAAGFAFDFLRDDLEAQAHRCRWQNEADAARSSDEARAAA